MALTNEKILEIPPKGTVENSPIATSLLLLSPTILESRRNVVEKAWEMLSISGDLKTLILQERVKGFEESCSMRR